MSMVRPARTAWPLLKFRQNHGIRTEELVEALGVSNVTINRLERGGIVLRVTAARYLKMLGIDLTKPETIPENITIVDHGDRVAIDFRE